MENLPRCGHAACSNLLAFFIRISSPYNHPSSETSQTLTPTPHRQRQTQQHPARDRRCQLPTQCRQRNRQLHGASQPGGGTRRCLSAVRRIGGSATLQGSSAAPTPPEKPIEANAGMSRVQHPGATPTPPYPNGRTSPQRRAPDDLHRLPRQDNAGACLEQHPQRRHRRNRRHSWPKLRLRDGSQQRPRR